MRAQAPSSIENPAEAEVQRHVGRLSLVVEPQPGSLEPAQAFSGAFELRGNAQIGEMDLLSPLGSIVLQLRWTPAGATLIRGQERSQHASAQSLLQQATGASIALADLFAWLHAKANRVEPVRYDNWMLDLSAREQGRIVARREQPSRAELRIVLELP
jgi:outer membrane lipoprotein LolB